MGTITGRTRKDGPTCGDITLPIVRIETSQKAQRGVHLIDLAAYIDKRREAVVKISDLNF